MSFNVDIPEDLSDEQLRSLSPNLIGCRDEKWWAALDRRIDTYFDQRGVKGPSFCVNCGDLDEQWYLVDEDLDEVPGTPVASPLGELLDKLVHWRPRHSL